MAGTGEWWRSCWRARSSAHWWPRPRSSSRSPPESQRRQLVIMARQAIERALVGDDAGAALFVLEEEAQERDPCVTLADSVLRSRKRALASTAVPPPPPAEAATRPARYRYDPLRRMMHRGTARLRQDMAVEDALCHAALQAAAPTPRPPRPPAPPPPRPPPSARWR